MDLPPGGTRVVQQEMEENEEVEASEEEEEAEVRDGMKMRRRGRRTTLIATSY